jgi:hypothetical protein
MSGVPFLQRGLDGSSTSDRIQRAGKLDKKSIANGFNFSALVLSQQSPNQFPLFIEELHRQGFISLGKRGKTDHIGKHNGGKPSLTIRLLGIFHSKSSPLIKIDWVVVNYQENTNEV